MTSSVRKIDTGGAPLTTPPLHLPDASSVLQNAVIKGLDYAAQKMKLGSAEMALEYVRHGDTTARSYCYYSLAKQVAEALGMLDENVKSVSIYEYDATPHDVSFRSESQVPPLHLLVWTERKTRALTSLLTVLDRTLAQQYAQLVGPRRLDHLLDAQLIDDADVENRIGLGALLSSIYNRPLSIWQR